MKRSIVAIFSMILAAAVAAQVKSRAIVEKAPKAGGTTGSIIGRATDRHGLPLPGVSVEAECDMGAGKVEAVTDADGRFRLFSLPPGAYTLVLSLPGFRPLTRKGITVRAREAISVGAVLEQEKPEEALRSRAELVEIGSDDGPLHRLRFIRGRTEEFMNEGDSAPLHAVCELGAAARLIAGGADVSARTSDGLTPLHFAANRGCSEVLELLLKNGAAVDQVDRFGWTPLHAAGASRSAEIAEALLRWGAGLESKTVDGWTPLHAALDTGTGEVAELLIARGADVKARTETGWTPLHFAALRACDDTAEELISAGADVNARDADGWTPLLVAEGAGHADLAKILIRHGARR